MEANPYWATVPGLKDVLPGDLSMVKEALQLCKGICGGCQTQEVVRFGEQYYNVLSYEYTEPMSWRQLVSLTQAKRYIMSVRISPRADQQRPALVLQVSTSSSLMSSANIFLAASASSPSSSDARERTADLERIRPRALVNDLDALFPDPEVRYPIRLEHMLAIKDKEPNEADLPVLNDVFCTLMALHEYRVLQDKPSDITWSWYPQRATYLMMAFGFSSAIDATDMTTLLCCAPMRIKDVLFNFVIGTDGCAARGALTVEISPAPIVPDESLLLMTMPPAREDTSVSPFSLYSPSGSPDLPKSNEEAAQLPLPSPQKAPLKRKAEQISQESGATFSSLLEQLVETVAPPPRGVAPPLDFSSQQQQQPPEEPQPSDAAAPPPPPPPSPVVVLEEARPVKRQRGFLMEIVVGVLGSFLQKKLLY
jgi:hypothetical protein